MANYIKHHEGWKNWSGNGKLRNRNTVEILRAVGIDQDGIDPIQMAIELLLPTDKNFDLEPLIWLIINWRSRVMSSIDL